MLKQVVKINKVSVRCFLGSSVYGAVCLVLLEECLWWWVASPMWTQMLWAAEENLGDGSHSPGEGIHQFIDIRVHCCTLATLTGILRVSRWWSCFSPVEEVLSTSLLVLFTITEGRVCGTGHLWGFLQHWHWAPLIHFKVLFQTLSLVNHIHNITKRTDIQARISLICLGLEFCLFIVTYRLSLCPLEYVFI